MKLKSLVLENYGPFSQYQLDFPNADQAIILLSGKNNAGKSSIIRALKLLSFVLKHSKSSTQPVTGKLAKKDTQDIEMGRLIHNYQDNGIALITAVLDNDKEIILSINSKDDTIYFEIPPYANKNLSDLIGFVPPLGQVAERESLVKKESVKDYLYTTYAPRHLRNHVHYLLDESEEEMVIEIINRYWKDISLQRLKLDAESSVFYWLYKEGIYSHEIAWAGQGLQIWLQIVTHMVWLKQKSIILLDEPELFLHPEKQHQLVQAIKEYFDGNAIIATHSSELMGNVDISHIINVQKNSTKNKVIPSTNRFELEKIRNSIGSGFNLVASQFEDVDLLVATEYQLDYDIVIKLSSLYGVVVKNQNVRVSGFSNREDVIQFKQAYSMFFGKEVKCTLLLDRDYYPSIYLDQIKTDLQKKKVKVVFTPGKEIENIFLSQHLLEFLVPPGGIEQFRIFLDTLYQSEYDNNFPKYVDFFRKYSAENKEYSTVYKEIKPSFDVHWNNKDTRHNLIHGKNAIASIRLYFKTNFNITLTTAMLLENLVKTNNLEAKILFTSILE
jgi:energy-coupling factor transporter ATP-binding protein EcfA2